MPIPIVYPYPVRRKGLIADARWIGGPEDMSLQVDYYALGGGLAAISFQTQGENAGEIALPANFLSNDPQGLGPRWRDVLVAHLRMACFAKGQAIPGTREFEQAFTEQIGAANFQTALGTTKVTAVEIVSDQLVRLTWRIGTGPTRTIDVSHDELNSYAYTPQTQLLVIPGAVRFEFGAAYDHNWPNVLLSESQKTDIANYVKGASFEPLI